LPLSISFNKASSSILFESACRAVQGEQAEQVWLKSIKPFMRY
jgi:hypothetical protein